MLYAMSPCMLNLRNKPIVFINDVIFVLLKKQVLSELCIKIDIFCRALEKKEEGRDCTCLGIK